MPIRHQAKRSLGKCGLKSLSNLFVALFLDACDTPPARITLDIDATDVETHGRQENAFFHGYYEHRCFLPLYVFCGSHLLLAQLSDPPTSMAPGVRATRSGASSR